MIDFFVQPAELIKWLESLLADETCWISSWSVRPNAYSIISSGARGEPHTPLSIGTGPGPHFFIGNKLLRPGPVMTTRPNGIAEIDFLESLCVRLWPCFIDGPVLLEGCLQSFAYSRYLTVPKGRQFWSWRQGLIASFKEAIPLPAVGSTLLEDGSVKSFKNVLISEACLDWWANGGKLKQFINGPFEYAPQLQKLH